MRIQASILLVFISSALADGPCDVNSDSCRSVINASACFNKFLSFGNKDQVLSCLTGTDGTATNQQKVNSLIQRL
ncbi:hypothetical protein KVR01_011902 [Diaporthe batatas]|uniref:uncharacterized protein n=1 Tax=Diaporthe batatas TaxID=748121 RepID=UPI001D0449B1|nr:uncharacterized protein KVR01_011902 [Diaporthe batatas]KAG8158141.1 hypothetical protein KVR01_011902 [Diaporthe batatas]